MGYYSSFSYEIVNSVFVDKNELDKIEKEFSDTNNDHLYGFFNVKFDIKCENNKTKLTGINVKDNYAKFYDCLIFARRLSEAILDGTIRLHFIGEDGCYGGYEVSNGSIEELVSIVVKQSDLNNLNISFDCLN
jgi:hypothetical protein